MAKHNKEFYLEVHMMYRRMTRRKHKHLAPPFDVETENRLYFSSHVKRRPSDRPIQAVLSMLPDPNWKRPPS
ncbi:hypothetical protein RB195_020230 [Necator americanus]|uniref:Uncharacterized protein n=1 Tax=Necator americanus TaxID=51031 RepID=A0ABR1CIU4_NECAM